MLPIDRGSKPMLQWAGDEVSATSASVPGVGTPGALSSGEAGNAPDVYVAQVQPHLPAGFIGDAARLYLYLADPRVPDPLPPSLNTMPSKWRRGPKYHKWKKQVHALYGDMCHICGHEGAGDADHLIPISVWRNQPYEPTMARPGHGVRGCAQCGQKCNQVRSNKPIEQLYVPPIRI